ncbi:MAG: hypothetical protein ABW019_11705 [Chitinophagaceae bacterium]
MNAAVKILIAGLAFLLPAIAHAKCTSSGIYTVSQNPTLNQNGWVILEFYASSQQLVAELDKKYPIYLQAGKEIITLKPIEVLRGEFLVTQVVFKPASTLKEGQTYTLHIDKLPEYETEPRQYNNGSGKWEAVTFRVRGYTDEQPPAFTSLPAEHKKTMVQFGCGPDRWVCFSLAVQDESETFVRARVKNIGTGLVTEYILAIENGQVMVGHGMCSGPFHFSGGNDFEVSFRLVDQSGNKSKPTTPVLFTAPVSPTDEG